MANINYIQVGFRQISNICLLTSYSLVLDYYKRLANEARGGN